MSIDIKKFGKLQPVTAEDDEKLVKEERKKSMGEYNKKHRKVIVAQQKKYNEEHEEEIIANSKKYYDENKEKIIKYSKAYRTRNLVLGSFGEKGFSVQLRQEVNATGKIIGVGHFAGPRTPEQNRKNTLKHKIKNATVLNEWFEGSEAHHVSEDIVIFIPKELHQSIWHNLETGENMEKINALAFEFLKKEKARR